MSSAHTALTDARIKDILRIYGVDADPKLCEQIRVYISTLLQWNAKISLTTIIDQDEILRVHFGESFFAASAAGIANGRLADIGTGAGFPGIPIRMVIPDVQLTLVEAVAKKAAFLGEIVRKIDISGAHIIRCRMEEIPTEMQDFDFVTARALGKYEGLLRWSRTRFSKIGKIILFLGRAEAEHLSKNPDWDWNEPRIVPEAASRVILVGSPKSSS